MKKNIRRTFYEVFILLFTLLLIFFTQLQNLQASIATNKTNLNITALTNIINKSTLGIRMDNSIYEFYPKTCTMKTQNQNQLVRKYEKTLSLLYAIEALRNGNQNQDSGDGNSSDLLFDEISKLSKSLRGKNDILINVDETKISQEFEDFDNDYRNNDASGLFSLKLIVKKLKVINKKISLHVSYFQTMIEHLSRYLNAPNPNAGQNLLPELCEYEFNKQVSTSNSNSNSNSNSTANKISNYINHIKIKREIRIDAEKLALQIYSQNNQNSKKNYCLALILKEKLETSIKILTATNDVFYGMVSCHERIIKRLLVVGKGGIGFSNPFSKAKILRGGGIMPKEKSIFERITTITQNYLYIRPNKNNKSKLY
ncbi:MAG: hypothetical protein HQK51_07225 [Oligoflexia bacterium]|nr:hypothetical protein [Oligoflexia bacterium]